MRIIRTSLATAAAVVLVAIAGATLHAAPTVPAATPAAPPPGPGLVVINERCSGCHTPATVFGQRRSADEWESTVQLMVDRGADLSPDDVTLVVGYLAQNYGPADAKAKTSQQ